LSVMLPQLSALGNAVTAAGNHTQDIRRR
jgi:hypothetical protein